MIDMKPRLRRGGADDPDRSFAGATGNDVALRGYRCSIGVQIAKHCTFETFEGKSRGRMLLVAKAN
jgi:hypothetical protein